MAGLCEGGNEPTGSLNASNRNVGACSDEPTTAAVTLSSLFFMLYLELRWMKLVLETLTWLEIEILAVARTLISTFVRLANHL
ncbi:hypothetical protein ANN_25610 [Periplaneta americana]|uniref:Uncharacterized protein n=1 Tax=Periplaneta americana TaxID=6978 RepID=A0ABQ8S1P0_PERAM|nr:hypothetical protein ANN_25610 [Periplaneta americana]